MDNENYDPKGDIDALMQAFLRQATAGNYVIAIAQEAYTTNDSAGVIDALVIPPRIL